MEKNTDDEWLELRWMGCIVIAVLLIEVSHLLITLITIESWRLFDGIGGTFFDMLWGFVTRALRLCVPTFVAIRVAPLVLRKRQRRAGAWTIAILLMLAFIIGIWFTVLDHRNIIIFDLNFRDGIWLSMTEHPWRFGLITAAFVATCVFTARGKRQSRLNRRESRDERGEMVS